MDQQTLLFDNEYFPEPSYRRQKSSSSVSTDALSSSSASLGEPLISEFKQGLPQVATPLRISSSGGRSRVQQLLSFIGGSLLLLFAFFRLWSYLHSTSSSSSLVPSPSPLLTFSSSPPILKPYGSLYLLSSSLPPTNPNEWLPEHYEAEFAAFERSFSKSYASEVERLHRFEIFVKNLKFINDHNFHRKARDLKFDLAINEFADLTQSEWSSTYLSLWHNSYDNEEDGQNDYGYNSNGLVFNPADSFSIPDRFPSKEFWEVIDALHPSPVVENLPKAVDWVEQGCVTEVKNQKKCGSCWAFSATGAVEGATCAQTGKLPDLSEQELVDCSSREGTHGCNGGFMDNAFQYIIDAGGLCAEADYPYLGVDGRECAAQNCTKAAKIAAILDIPKKNARALKTAVALLGPVSVGIEADRPTFQFYHQGVFDQACGKKLDHGVLVVGYGEWDGETYYLVKNSWGGLWGDKGYIKLGAKHHGHSGECGILLAPSVPLITVPNNIMEEGSPSPSYKEEDDF